jgi:hypothetical protein
MMFFRENGKYYHNVTGYYMSWYRIPQVPLEKVVKLLKKHYDILEGNHTSNTKVDKFAKDTYIAFHDITEEDYIRSMTISQRNRVWSMVWGDFHQQLIGCMSTWDALKKGDVSGCDNVSKDGKCIAEVKNNTNTMNSSSQKSVIEKLQKQQKLGKRALLVIMNGDMPSKIGDGVEWINGRDFYAEISGSSTFFDDLHTTVVYIFRHYKTYAELKNVLI